MSSKNYIVIVAAALAFGCWGVGGVFARASAAGISNAPLVNITNITKTVFPLSLPVGGGEVVFTYRVTNPGTIPLNNVTVSDDKCSAMSGELGDTNANHLLDPNEAWIYTCRAAITTTTANTASVIAYANGLTATAHDTITVDVVASGAAAASGATTTQSVVPGLPDNGTNPNAFNITAAIWEALGGILIALVVVLLFIKKKK
jgi:hypothetical protein